MGKVRLAELQNAKASPSFKTARSDITTKHELIRNEKMRKPQYMTKREIWPIGLSSAG